MMRCATNVASLCLLLALLILSSGAQPVAEELRPIDLAICLDTSGSMSGLIEAAKQKLWAVVNELVQATPTPYLCVALIQYDNVGNRKTMVGGTDWTATGADLPANNWTVDQDDAPAPTLASTVTSVAQGTTRCSVECYYGVGHPLKPLLPPREIDSYE